MFPRLSVSVRISMLSLIHICEPLVSRRIIPLIRDIRAIPQIEDISLTTNGALLPKLAPQLKDAGLNLSLIHIWMYLRLPRPACQ